MQLGLAELTSRLNQAGVSILKQHRMTGRLATFFLSEAMNATPIL